MADQRNHLEMKKLLFLIESDQYGGSEKYLSILLQGLNKNKYEIIFISKNQTVGNEIIKNHLRIKNLSFKRFNLFNLIRVFRNEKPQMIHINFHVPCSCLWAVLAAKIIRIPFIIGTIHSTVLTTSNILFVKILKKTIVLFIYHFVNLFITVSNKSKEELHFDYKIPNENIRVVYNGIDFLEQGNIDKEEVYREKSRLGLQENAKVVGVVSRLVKNKEVEVFLSSIPHVLKVIPDAKFIIIGDGNLSKKLKGLTAVLGIERDVYFTGNRKNIKTMLELLDVFVLPSLHETFSFAIAEAMAAGLPVVATNVGGIPELVEDGITGLLIPSENPKLLTDAIVELLKDPNKCKQMGQRGQDRIRKYFTIEKMIENTEKIYDELSFL